MVRFLKKGGRPAFAILDIVEYDSLVRAAEDAEDIAAIRAARADPGELLPSRVTKRLIDGENPVRVWREYRGLTQVELAAGAEIDQAYLSKIERRGRTGTVKVLRSLADALGVDLDDLA